MAARIRDPSLPLSLGKKGRKGRKRHIEHLGPEEEGERGGGAKGGGGGGILLLKIPLRSLLGYHTVKEGGRQVFFGPCVTKKSRRVFL